MAELVPLDRRGGWHKRQREAEEVAVGVVGPLPRRQRPADALADWFGGNTNRVVPTLKTLLQIDEERVRELLGRVNPAELFSYITPVLLLHQDEKIDPINTEITSTINDVARDRRELLQMKLRKKINDARHREIVKALSCFPGKVQEMQGRIRELNGRYVRIPPLLVTPVELLP